MLTLVDPALIIAHAASETSAGVTRLNNVLAPNLFTPLTDLVPERSKVKVQRSEVKSQNQRSLKVMAF